MKCAMGVLILSAHLANTPITAHWWILQPGEIVDKSRHLPIIRTSRTLQRRIVAATENGVCARRSDNNVHTVDTVNTVNAERGVLVFLIQSKRFQFNDGCTHSRENT